MVYAAKQVLQNQRGMSGPAELKVVIFWAWLGLKAQALAC